MSRPSDRAIAQAWDEYCAQYHGCMKVISDAQYAVTRRAREIDATAAPVVVVTEEMVTRGTLAYLAQIESQMTMTKRINPAIKAALTAALAGD